MDEPKNPAYAQNIANLIVALVRRLWPVIEHKAGPVGDADGVETVGQHPVEAGPKPRVETPLASADLRWGQQATISGGGY